MLRLQKYLSEQGFCSRRKAEELIRQKKILINGAFVTLGDKVSDTDVIVINGEKLIPRKKPSIVLAFHKPKGVECTLSKRENTKTLVDFNFGKDRFFPIGRLDKDSRGLLLLTNDGDLCNRISHPRHEHDKEYLVTVDRKLTPECIYTLSHGVLLNEKKTKSCEVELIKSKVFRMVLQEGRNRQIRKMCESLEYKVTDLIRIRVKNIHLGELPAGKYRVLSSAETKGLKI